MANGLPTNWTIGGGQPAPPAKQSYREATQRRGFPRRGRVVREEGEKLLVAFYTTGEELVDRGDVTVVTRQPR